MFSRRPDRPREEPRQAGTAPTGRPGDLAPIPTDPGAPWGASPLPGAPAPGGSPAGVPQSGAMPPSGPDPATVAASRGDATVIAEHDHLEGTLRSAQGVLVLGSFSGSIESESWVRMGERSTVKADVTAQEVVVAGSYEGRLVASGRLEIAATGQVRGDIVAPRLLLHEGGFIDGALSMTRPEPGRPGAAPTERGRAGEERGQEAASRPGSVRESSGAGSPRKGAAAIPVEREASASPATETPAAR